MPAQSGLFTSAASTGGLLGEAQINGLAAGVTAQVNLSDAVSGLAVSTTILALAGDGHDNPGFTSGFGVIYSTNAGQTWVDASLFSNMAGGGQIVSAATNLRGFTVFNGRLYVADGANGKVYSSADGNSWIGSNGNVSLTGGATGIRPLISYNGRLFAGDGAGRIWATTDGSSWLQMLPTPTNAPQVTASGAAIQSFAVFNGRLYAGDNATPGRVYVSTSGDTWVMTQGANGSPLLPQSLAAAGPVNALAVFNGRLFAADNTGRMYASVDGSTWTALNSYNPIGSNFSVLLPFNNKLYAADQGNGKFFSSPDGNTWIALAGGPQPGGSINALTSLGGKLYASDSTGKIYVSTEGSTWLILNSSNPVSIGGSPILGLAPFNGKLYGGDNAGRVYQVAPVSATLTTNGLAAVDGVTSVSSLTAYGLNLVNSTNAIACGGTWPCGATNQVIFTAIDRAGLQQRFGPYQIIVDTLTSSALAVSTPGVPANGAFVNFQVPTTYGGVSTNFAWTGPSSTTVAALPPGSSYYLQVTNDPTFASVPLISISTPAVLVSTTLANVTAGYISTFTLTTNTTYYWRVALTNGLFGVLAPWSSTSSFVTDFGGPTFTPPFTSLNVAGQTVIETQVNNLGTGVTAQITITDAQSGLVVSTSVLTFAGDGHEGPSPASAFGVLYSTSQGRYWIDFSTPVMMNHGSPVGSGLYALAVFNGKLFAADGSPTSGGNVYSSVDGNTWLGPQYNPIPVGAPLRALVAFNGRLFAADAVGRIWVSADGQTWAPTNGGVAVANNIQSMAVFNGRLYAGDAALPGRVYVSTSGDTWATPQIGNYGIAGSIRSLAVFNGRLFAGDGSGRIVMSVDGSTWTSSNGGGVVSVQNSSITALAAYKNRFFAGDALGRVYVSTDGGNSWTGTNGNGAAGVPVSSGGAIVSLTSFNGKMYAGDTGGRVYVSTEGSAWVVTNSSYPIGTSIYGLAPFNGKLFAADSYSGAVYQLTPAAVSLSGTDGATDAQTLAGTLNLVNSTNTIACYGYMPCGANNQVIFTASDRAGNVFKVGPYAIQVDATTSMAVSTPSYPASGAYVTAQPNFNWTGPSTAVVAGLPPGSSYYLQVSNNDPAFSAGNIIISMSTPAIVTSTMMATGFGAYLSTYSLANAATFYWRVQTVNGVYGSASAWSQTSSFVTDFVAPAAVGNFTSVNLASLSIGEAVINGVSVGVVANLPVQDALSGLVVSTNVLAFAGDGHDNPGVTGAFGVSYSTNGGQTWVDASTVTSMSNGAVIYTGPPSNASQLRGLAVAGGKIFAVDGANGLIYVSADGNSWSRSNSLNGYVAPGGTLRPLLVAANGRIYTGDHVGRIFVTANGGSSWSQSNNSVAVGTSAILSLASFNGRLFAGDFAGRVYVSSDGTTWTAASTNAVVGTGAIWSLAAFNGRLFAGDSLGRVFASVDGATWAYTNGAGGSGTPLFAGASISGLTAFNNKLVAIDSATGRVFVSTDGNNWNGGVQAAGGSALQSLAAFNGKLYVGDGAGKIFISTEGSTWLATNGGYAIAVSTLYALAPFNGRLFAADAGGYAFQVTPVTATLSGSDGSTTAQTLTASGMNLANSLNTQTCGGLWPCAATNQVMFTAFDRAGNAQRLGPYAVQVDATTTLAISTPSFPANGAYVTTGTVNFNWTGPSTTTLAGLSVGTSYYLQVSKDPSFATNIVVAITTPAVQVSTVLPTGFAAYLSTFTLPNLTTYYWRVQALNGASGVQGIWSSSFSFVTEILPPVQSGLFTSASSTGGLLGEAQINALAAGVTAQINLFAAVSGLAVSTGALALPGDGHDSPGQTSGFGVSYSTNAGQTWVDASAIAGMNGGAVIVTGAANLRGFTVFNNRLFVADGANGKVYSSGDGNIWTASNSGSTLGGSAIRALIVFNGKLYAGDAGGKVYSSPDGTVTNWTTTNGGFALGPSANITSLAIFNGRLFAGDAGLGRIYVTVDGNTWAMVQGGIVPFQTMLGGQVQSLAVYNGRLYAGDSLGRVYASVDGSTWTAINNYGVQLGGAAGNIGALLAFNNKLYAADQSNGKIYFMNQDANTWTQVSGGPQGVAINAVSAFNGKLYGADNNGRVWVSTEGSSWLVINSSFPISVAGSPLFGLTPFNGKLYAGDNAGRVYQITPVSATLTTNGFAAVDGTTAVSSLAVYGLNLVNSTNALTCGGNWPCGATNQVIFTASDRAGVQARFGPYAVLVDTLTSTGLAVSTPGVPANGAFVNIQLPTTYGGVSTNFAWTGPSSTTVAALPSGSSYYLQVSNDPTFASVPLISISTPAVLVSTTLANVTAGYISTFTLTTNTTYYWRVALTNGLFGTLAPWSSTFSFVTDFSAPALTPPSNNFASLNAFGQTVAETQVNNLGTGVTAQITLTDTNSGLAISTSLLTFAGDGHEGPYQTGAFGVLYSTSSSIQNRFWIDFSTPVMTNHGSPVGSGLYALAVFNGKLFAADGSPASGGNVYSSVDGNTWLGPQYNPIPVGAPLRALVAFNGRLFAADAVGRVWVSADGQTWAATNGGVAVANNIQAMAVFNGRLYAGDSAMPGRVYVSTSGDTWATPQCGLPAYGIAGPIRSLAVFNGRLFAGDGSGRVVMSVDGSTWTSSNGGAVVAFQNSTITALATYNNRFFAGDALGRVYVSTDGGNSWNGVNGVSSGAAIASLSSFNGKMYAGDAGGRVWVSTDGSAWLVTNSSYPVGTNMYGLAAFNGKLFAAARRMRRRWPGR
ncbi:MAG: hypothetical protein NTX64_01735 [Elusimicrobia bacterium]|nr:hypothetical protein [Elusimicrobiota bacterium]